MITKNTIRTFLSKYINNDAYANADNLFTKGLVSSLFAMQLVAYLESNFNLAIDNSELDIENFKSVDAISDFVERKLAA